MKTSDAPSRRERARARQRETFMRARRAEIIYARRLRQIAVQVGRFADAMTDDPAALEALLRRFATMIMPWARSTATSMLLDVSRRDETAWFNFARDMSRNVGLEIRSTPLGEIFRALLDEQVKLITSIPMDAAQRVRDLALINLEEGRRAEDLARALRASRSVSAAKANLIARTETGRAATEFTRVRAEHIGSTHFIWRTALDADVRERHRDLEGKVFPWNDPPVAGERGEHALPGAIYNCRCVALPIVPDF